MGAWSHEPFGNDSACDWAFDLDGTSDFSAIEQALDEMIEAVDDYLDADLGSAAVAAAEVILRLLGQPTQTDVPEGVDEWTNHMTVQPSIVLIQKALQALSLVMTEESELNELWMESGEYLIWQDNILKIQELLSENLI